MYKAVALVRVDLETTFMGLPSMAGCQLCGRPVLEHVVRRVACVQSVQQVVLVHPKGQDPLGLLGGCDIGKPVVGFAWDGGVGGGLRDRGSAMIAASRKWSLESWRGGLGGATCYDELLPAEPMAAALREYDAQAGLLVGGDWVFVDPGFSGEVLDLHLANHDSMQMTFSQAPPGLAGVAVSRELLEQLAENGTNFGRVLAYNPTRPQADPIGRDVCVQIDSSVRGCKRRFIYDTKPSVQMIDWIAGQLGERTNGASAVQVAGIVGNVDDETACGFAQLPREITLELTPRRQADGLLVPQRYAQFDRQDMDIKLAQRLVEQMGSDGDVVLTLGGLGDVLLYEGWEQVVQAAHRAGVLGIAIETDLLVDDAVVERVMSLPIDVVSVRLNADTAKTYSAVMGIEGEGGFEAVVKHLQTMLSGRTDRLNSDKGYGQWVVPRLIKTAETLGDMETFYDRWVHFGGHAVIEGAKTGCGVMPDLSPVVMAPPRRFGCRQVDGRMTILSDGSVAQCDQDWLASGRGGDAKIDTLAAIWRAMRVVREAHGQGRWDQLELCGACSEWHRP